jgi:hypothetical protein
MNRPAELNDVRVATLGEVGQRGSGTPKRECDTARSHLGPQ